MVLNFSFFYFLLIFTIFDITPPIFSFAVSSCLWSSFDCILILHYALKLPCNYERFCRTWLNFWSLPWELIYSVILDPFLLLACVSPGKTTTTNPIQNKWQPHWGKQGKQMSIQNNADVSFIFCNCFIPKLSSSSPLFVSIF